MTSPPPSVAPPHRAWLVVIALLAGMVGALAAALIATTLNAETLDIVKWAGGTFVAVTLFVLRIHDEFR